MTELGGLRVVEEGSKDDRDRLQQRAMKGSLWESSRGGSLSPSLFAQLIYSLP